MRCTFHKTLLIPPKNIPENFEKYDPCVQITRTSIDCFTYRSTLMFIGNYITISKSIHHFDKAIFTDTSISTINRIFEFSTDVFRNHRSNIPSRHTLPVSDTHLWSSTSFLILTAIDPTRTYQLAFVSVISLGWELRAKSPQDVATFPRTSEVLCSASDGPRDRGGSTVCVSGLSCDGLTVYGPSLVEEEVARVTFVMETMQVCCACVLTFCMICSCNNCLICFYSVIWYNEIYFFYIIDSDRERNFV